METSTPIRVPDVPLRKHVLQSRVSLTPLRRKSQAPLNCSIETIVNDDERERSNRRDKEVENRRLSNIILQQQTDSPKLDGPQLTKHYDMCLKMYSENKINSQNVWNLRIIDYMKTILHDQTNISNTFQVASATLDVSTKVYGIRVDDICSDGMKLVSSMARNSAKGKENNEDGIENDEPLSDGERPEKENVKKTKRKTKFKRTTLAKNIESLLGPVLQLDSASILSSLNRTTSQTTENLFMKKLPLNHGGNMLEILSYAREFMPKEKPQTFITNDRLVPQILPTDGTNFEICPAFRDFVIDKWNPDEENISMMNESSKLEQVVMDANGMPIAELDGSVHDIFSQADDGADMEPDMFEEEGVEALQLHGDIAHVQDFRPNSQNTRGNEYLHNTAITEHRAVVSGLWAGPSHWKVKYIHNRASARYSGKHFEGQIQKPVRSRKLKPLPQSLTFIIEDVNINDYAPTDTNNILKTTYIPTDKYLDLVEDFNLKIDLPCSLLKDGLKIGGKWIKPGENQNIDNEEKGGEDDVLSVGADNDGFDYENPNDAEYCSQASIHDIQDEAVNENGEHCGIMENLVDAPELVQKTYVSYATQAKKMDMKKLKTVIFETMNKKSCKSVTKPEFEECLFSDVYALLPKVLPAKMAKELSCPLAFVSLLHLCNENNLELEEMQRTDIRIFKKCSGNKRKLV